MLRDERIWVTTKSVTTSQNENRFKQRGVAVGCGILSSTWNVPKSLGDAMASTAARLIMRFSAGKSAKILTFATLGLAMRHF